MKNQSLEVCIAGMVPVLRRANQRPILAQQPYPLWSCKEWNRRTEENIKKVLDKRNPHRSRYPTISMMQDMLEISVFLTLELTRQTGSQQKPGRLSSELLCISLFLHDQCEMCPITTAFEKELFSCLVFPYYLLPSLHVYSSWKFVLSAPPNLVAHILKLFLNSRIRGVFDVNQFVLDPFRFPADPAYGNAYTTNWPDNFPYSFHYDSRA